MRLWVYFIQQGKRGPIKIGVTGSAPLSRLAQIQGANPTKLYLIGSFLTEHARGYEAEMHRALAEWRVRGEWFKPSSEVLALIDQFRDPSRKAVA